MVRHIILWKLKDNLSESEKTAIKADAKAGLEALNGNIPGLTSISVHIDGLNTSNADMMLESSFENVESLKDYSQNPLHVEVANTKIRPFISDRVCLDFESEK